MKNFGFTIWVKDINDNLEAWTNALFEAGCDDSSPGIFCGQPYTHFDRASSNLESAIGSAIQDVRKTGVEVDRVEIVAEDIEELAAAT